MGCVPSLPKRAADRHGRCPFRQVPVCAVCCVGGSQQRMNRPHLRVCNKGEGERQMLKGSENDSSGMSRAWRGRRLEAEGQTHGTGS